MKYYRYATLMRPAGLGAVPREGLDHCQDAEGTAPSGHSIWSICDYTRKLTDKELHDYEMEFLHDLDFDI